MTVTSASKIRLAIMAMPGKIYADADIGSAADLHNWLADLPGCGQSDLCLNLGDGSLRRVISINGAGRVLAVRVFAGMIGASAVMPISTCQKVWEAIQQTVSDEISRAGIDVNRADCPRYRTRADAWQDGWEVGPRTEDYRDWRILPFYRREILHAYIRETSGDPAHRGLRFRWLRPPVAPLTHPVTIDDCINHGGHRDQLLHLARRADFATYIDECKSLIDLRRDGRRNIDLSEIIECPP